MYGTSDERYVQRLTVHVATVQVQVQVQVQSQATPSARGECQMQGRVTYSAWYSSCRIW